jgi:hypothetical protein
VPLLPLLDLDRTFYVDWGNHLWLIEHLRKCFIEDLRFPLVISTEQLTGLAFPIFYGGHFYRALAALSVALGTDVALRVAIWGLIAIQWLSIFQMARHTGARAHEAGGIATVATWAIYPLTNLYNRNAIPEFAASALLTCTASWLIIALTTAQLARARVFCRASLSVFFLALCTHSISAFLGVSFLLILATILLLGRFSPNIRRLLNDPLIIYTIVLGTLALLPWVEAVRLFGEHLNVRYTIPDAPHVYSFDHWYARFFPLPFDPRSLTRGIHGVATPYLDLQINLPLVLLVLAELGIVHRSPFSGRRRVLASTALMIAFLCLATAMSLSRAPYEWLPSIFRNVQMSYRMITYINLAALCALALLLTGRRSQQPSPHRSTTFLTMSVTWASLAVVLKLTHAVAIGSHASEEVWKNWRALPPDFYGRSDYTSPALFASHPSNTNEHRMVLKSPDGLRCGGFASAHIDTPKADLFRTNILAFPWNIPHLDGTPLQPQQVYQRDKELVVQIPAGQHRLELRFSPPRYWENLQLISTVAFSLILALFGYFFTQTLLEEVGE